MTKLFFKVQWLVPGIALSPSDDHTYEVLSKYQPGDIVTMKEPRKPRNPKHHAKYWAMLKLIHEGTAVQDLYPNTDKLHQAIKGALGYYSEVKLPDGKVFQVVDSIAFESMDQQAFEEFYEKAVNLIVTQVVPNLDRDDLERQVMEMVSK